MTPAEAGSTGLRPIPIDRATRVIEHPKGRAIVLGDLQNRHYLWILDPLALDRPAVNIPIDDTIALRTVAVTRLWRHLSGKRPGALPPPLRLTSARIARLIRQLHVLDFHLLGVPPREIAILLFGQQAETLRAVEWKSSALRRQIMRLIEDGDALMNGG